MRDGVDLVELGGVGITVGQSRRIFQRRLGQCGSVFSSLEEKVGFQAIRGRARNRLAKLLLRLVGPLNGRLPGLGRLATRLIVLDRAGGEDGAAQGEAQGRADPFFLTHGSAERRESPKRSNAKGDKVVSLPAGWGREALRR